MIDHGFVPGPVDDARPDDRAQRGEQDEEHDAREDAGEEQEPEDARQPEAALAAVGAGRTRRPAGCPARRTPATRASPARAARGRCEPSPGHAGAAPSVELVLEDDRGGLAVHAFTIAVPLRLRRRAAGAAAGHRDPGEIRRGGWRAARRAASRGSPRRVRDGLRPRGGGLGHRALGAARLERQPDDELRDPLLRDDPRQRGGIVRRGQRSRPVDRRERPRRQPVALGDREADPPLPEVDPEDAAAVRRSVTASRRRRRRGAARASVERDPVRRWSGSS